MSWNVPIIDEFNLIDEEPSGALKPEEVNFLIRLKTEKLIARIATLELKVKWLEEAFRRLKNEQ